MPSKGFATGATRYDAMHRLPPDRTIWLQPGEHRAVTGPWILSTLLGSCIAACLYDEVAGVSGMNHFLLANMRYALHMPMSVTEAGRYGINAMELLINSMLKLGAAKARFRAKVFGGSAIGSRTLGQKQTCVGEVNQRFIREFLELEHIPIDAADVGGLRGRVIHFHTDSLKVYRRYIHNTGINAQILADEEAAWESGVRDAGLQGDAFLF